MAKRKDLTGQVFGRLTVVQFVEKVGCHSRWECLCECGQRKNVLGTHLVQQKILSCGCYGRERTSETNRKDIANQRFGRLVAQTPVGRRRSFVLWRCLCDCGQQTDVASAKLLNGITKSCGCLRLDVTRQRFTTHGQSHTKAHRAFREKTRRAKKMERLPAWADIEAIRNFYAKCPDGMTVDHILPLQGVLISGFHVVENLQYLTPRENFSKKNKFIPYIEHSGHENMEREILAIIARRV